MRCAKVRLFQCRSGRRQRHGAPRDRHQRRTVAARNRDLLRQAAGTIERAPRPAERIGGRTRLICRIAGLVIASIERDLAPGERKTGVEKTITMIPVMTVVVMSEFPKSRPHFAVSSSVIRRAVYERKR